jgi:glucose-6-phosphate 1-epimerase
VPRPTASFQNILENAASATYVCAEKGPCIAIQNAAASALISLHGAQLLSYCPSHDNRERLWVSAQAVFDQNKAIRGGAPICWPWFGPNKQDKRLPAHGFVRTQTWDLIEANEIVSRDTVKQTVCRFRPKQLGLLNTPETLDVVLQISIGETCELRLTTTNQGEHSVNLSQAIHTYFAIGDIHKVQIKGVDTSYFNKIDDSQNNLSPVPYCITSETDRVHEYPSNDPQMISLEADQAPLVHIEQHGHNGTVVWNPWIDKTAALKDMDDEDYMHMLCIEAVTEPQIELKAGQQQVLTQRFR